MRKVHHEGGRSGTACPGRAGGTCDRRSRVRESLGGLQRDGRLARARGRQPAAVSADRGRDVVPRRRERATEDGGYPAVQPGRPDLRPRRRGGHAELGARRRRSNLYDVAAVVMKGGPDAMVYHYDAGGQRVATTPTPGITTPINPATEQRRQRGAAPVWHQPRRLLLRPEGAHGPKDLVVTKTAQTSWEKVYNWDVEKSVDKSQLDMKQGETGTVQWKVDVTQTGSTVAERGRERHHHRRRTRTTRQRHGRLRHGPASGGGRRLRRRCWGAERLDGPDGAGEREPVTCTYSAPRDSTHGRDERGHRDRLARRRRHLRQRDRGLHVR